MGFEDILYISKMTLKIEFRPEL